MVDIKKRSWYKMASVQSAAVLVALLAGLTAIRGEWQEYVGLLIVGVPYCVYNFYACDIER